MESGSAARGRRGVRAVAAAALLMLPASGLAQEAALAEHGFVLVPMRGTASSEALPLPWCETVDHAAFALEPFEALHPRLPAGFSALFIGDVRCATAGDYTFRVECEGGDAFLLIENSSDSWLSVTRPYDDDAVRDYAWRTDRPRTVRVSLAVLRRGDSRARLRLSWQLRNAGAASFAFEPLPTRVVTPPPEALAARTAAALAARGRVELLELGCTNCHDAGYARALFPRRGAVDLAGVAARVDEAWLRRWIASPQSLAPGSGMPDVLGEDVAPETVHELIAALRGPSADAMPPAPALDAAQSASGRVLYHSLGCVACHGALASPAVAFGDRQLDASLPIGPVAAPFGDLAGKWRVDGLARFLADPVAVRTHGRMPSFGLSEAEATALAHYLVEQFGAAPVRSDVAVAPSPATSPDAAAIARGEALCAKLRCDRCHTVGAERVDDARYPEGPSDAVAPPLAKLDGSRGCLAPTREQRGTAPHYELSREQRAALVAALEQVPTTIVVAPLQQARDLKAALRCDACHAMQGDADRGRWSSYFRCTAEADLGDEGRLAPRLDGVGTRLQSPWLEQVIGDGARARPYLAARMPRFGSAIARELTRGLAALEGEWRSDDPTAIAAARPTLPLASHRAPGDSDESLAVVGRQLAGSGGMNCITCHSFGERPSAGTPGLDFLQFRQRLRRDAFATYALAPARVKPGTRMPRYFEEGRSVVEGVLDGDPARQIDALWCWFERASSMPAPEGVPTGERQRLPVGDRPIVVRAFMERAGVRGIAIGTPSGLHFAFDAAQVRLVEAWSGDFLDVAPIWDGRGGGIVGQLGPRVWSAPPGPLLALDPAVAGAPKFLGYRLEPDGTPTFQWTLAGHGGAIEVDEQFLPDPRPDVLFVRRLEIRGASSEHPVWLANLGDRATLVGNASLPLAPTDPGGVVRVTIEVR